MSFAAEAVPAFVGHSDYLPALAGYDVKSPLMGKPPHMTPMSPEASLGRNASFIGGFFEIFVPPVEPVGFVRTDTGFVADYPPPLAPAYALERTMHGIRALLDVTSAAGSRIRLARSVAEIEQAREAGDIAAVLHLGDADAIDTSFDALHVLQAVGVRSMALTWSRRNRFGYGAPYRYPGSPDIGPGLTEEGRALVRACNRLGIVVDLAHLNEAGFRDVAEISDAPLIVSHGAAHALFPSTRAATDAQLELIAASGGLIGVSTEGVSSTPDTLVDDLVAHVHHIADRIGVRNVALGADLYRPASPEHPDGELMAALVLSRLAEGGWDAEMLAALAWENWRRVLFAIWGE